MDNTDKVISLVDATNEMGLIIRTAGLNKTKNEIRKDYTTLKKLWVQIVNETKKANGSIPPIMNVLAPRTNTNPPITFRSV